MADQNRVEFPAEFLAAFSTASTSSCPPTAPSTSAAPQTATTGQMANAPPHRLSSIMNQTVQVDEFTNAFLRCMEEALPEMLFPAHTPQTSVSLASTGTASASPSVTATAPTLEVASPAVPYDSTLTLAHITRVRNPQRCASAAASTKNPFVADGRRPLSAQMLTASVAPSVGSNRTTTSSARQDSGALPTDIASAPRQSTSSANAPTNAPVAMPSVESMDHYASKAWVEAFRQFHIPCLGGSDEFHRRWPEYAGLELAYIDRSILYSNLRQASTVNPHSAAQAAELKGATIDLSKSVRRLQLFVALVRMRPVELRELLSRNCTFNEVFQRLPLPEERVDDPLRNDVYEWSEDNLPTSTMQAVSKYFEKRLGTKTTTLSVDYRCLFDGCSYTTSRGKNVCKNTTRALRRHIFNSHPTETLPSVPPHATDAKLHGATPLPALNANNPQLYPLTYSTDANGRYKCDFCAKTSPSQLALQRHYDEDHRPKRIRYECVTCRRTFDDAATCAGHILDCRHKGQSSDATVSTQGPSTSMATASAQAPSTSVAAAAPSEQQALPTKKVRPSILRGSISTPAPSAAATRVAHRTSPQMRQLRREWPDYCALNNDYNEKWKRYIGYLCDMEAIDSDNATDQDQLKTYFDEYADAKTMMDNFELLVEHQPHELRKLLGQGRELVDVISELLTSMLGGSGAPPHDAPPAAESEALSRSVSATLPLTEAEVPSAAMCDALRAIASEGSPLSASHVPPLTEIGPPLEAASEASMEVAPEAPMEAASAAPSVSTPGVPMDAPAIAVSEAPPRISAEAQVDVVASEALVESVHEAPPTARFDTPLEAMFHTLPLATSVEHPQMAAVSEAPLVAESDVPPTPESHNPPAAFSQTDVATSAAPQPMATSEHAAAASDAPPAATSTAPSPAAFEAPPAAVTSAAPLKSGPKPLSYATSSIKGRTFKPPRPTFEWFSPARHLLSVAKKRKTSGPKTSSSKCSPLTTKSALSQRPHVPSGPRIVCHSSLLPPTTTVESSSMARVAPPATEQQSSLAPSEGRKLELELHVGSDDPSEDSENEPPQGAQLVSTPSNSSPKKLRAIGDFYCDFFERTEIDGKVQFKCVIDRCGYTIVGEDERRNPFSFHIRQNHADALRSTEHHPSTKKIVAQKVKSEQEDPVSIAKWPYYTLLKDKYLSKQRNYKLLEGKLQKNIDDEAVLAAGVSELEERRQALMRAERRLDKFVELTRTHSDELRPLLRQGLSFNVILRRLVGDDTGGSSVEADDLHDLEEEAEEKGWSTVDYSAFFTKSNADGVTYHHCRMQQCNFAFGSVSQPPNVLAWKFRDHFADKHRPCNSSSMSSLQQKAYTYWEEWPQIKELERKQERATTSEPSVSTSTSNSSDGSLHFQCMHQLVKNCSYVSTAVSLMDALQSGASVEEIVLQLEDKLPFSSQKKLRQSHLDKITLLEDQLNGRDLMPDDYRQVFSVNDNGQRRCMFVDCEAAFAQGCTDEELHMLMKAHCESAHFSL